MSLTSLVQPDWILRHYGCSVVATLQSHPHSHAQWHLLEALGARTQATLRLYDQMMDVGFQPDAITYTLLIKVANMSPWTLA